jgi:hypothetical protein
VQHTAASAPTQQALGFNAPPQFSSGTEYLSTGGHKPVIKQYFTAEDIEEEIRREQEAAAQAVTLTSPKPGYSQAAQANDSNPPAGAPAASPFAPPNFAAPGAVSNPAHSPSTPGGASASAGPSGQSLPSQQPDQQFDEEGADLSSIPEIETGRIWENRTSKEILLGILKSKKAEYAVALLASTDGTVQGEMLIVKSVVIHGAKLVEPDLSGYEALKVMLAIPHGTYTLLDVSEYVEQAQQLEQGLNIRLTPLANALPHLPESAEELAGASNISRIRSKGPVDLEAAEPVKKPPQQQMTLRERLPSTKILVLSGLTFLALVMMIVVLFMKH